MLMSLSTGAVDAVCGDNDSIAYYANLEGFVFNFLYDDEIMPGVNYAIGLRKGDTALCDKLSELLIELSQEGTATTISEQWFGMDITTINESY